MVKYLNIVQTCQICKPIIAYPARIQIQILQIC